MDIKKTILRKLILNNIKSKLAEERDDMERATEYYFAVCELQSLCSQLGYKDVLDKFLNIAKELDL